MQRLILLAVMGFAAQLVDGALGMAYGLTSTTLLLTVGLTPALASASVHLAEVGTTLASGAAHWKLGNVDWRTVRWMAVPGGVGAFLGAVALSSISADVAKPWISGFLVILGAYILIRFSLLKARPVLGRALSGRFLVPLGLGAGFLDATGGGGWGPISTPTLLASGRMQPRKVVGTVDTSEFLVAVCASIGFLIALDSSQIAFPIVGALLVGGLIAAPMAAWLVRNLHPRILGTVVGGLILFTNGRTLVREFGVAGEPLLSVYAFIILTWVVAVSAALVTVRRERASGVSEMSPGQLPRRAPSSGNSAATLQPSYTLTPKRRQLKDDETKDSDSLFIIILGAVSVAALPLARSHAVFRAMRLDQSHALEIRPVDSGAL